MWKVLVGLLLLLWCSMHLEFQDPFAVPDILYGSNMSEQEIQQNPIKANSLTVAASKQMYDVLDKTLRLLKKHKIKYWVTCGTLLGAMRHQGIVPWDDDLDLCIFDADKDKLLNLKSELENIGLGIYKDKTSIKIYPLDGRLLRPKRWSFKILPNVWFVRRKNERFPTIDVYPMIKDNSSKWVCSFAKARISFPNEYYYPEEIKEFKSYNFGSLVVLGPINPLPFLQRNYGDTWKTRWVLNMRHAVHNMPGFDILAS